MLLTLWANARPPSNEWLLAEPGFRERSLTYLQQQTRTLAPSTASVVQVQTVSTEVTE